MTQSATLRTLQILELLSGQAEGLALSEIGGSLEIPKSVGHRLLSQLTQLGYVQQDEPNGRYRLTLKLTLLGLRHYAATGLTDLGQPILDRLAAMSGELARLAVVHGDGMHWVAKAQGARYGLRYDPEAGHEVVLHATAVGKVWLSTLPESKAVAIVTANSFRTPSRCGPNAVRSVAALRAALAETRARGYGVAIEEGEPGMSAIAAIVRASREKEAPAVGTLSIAGPAARFTASQREIFARELLAAAAEMSALWPVRRGPSSAREAQRLEQGELAHVR